MALENDDHDEEPFPCHCEPLPLFFLVLRSLDDTQDSSYQIFELLKSGSAFSLLRAQELAREWITRQPDSAEAHVNMGLVAVANQEQDSGLKYFQRATELDPAEPVAWKNLAMALHSKNASEEAVVCVVKALDLSDNLAEELDAIALLGIIQFNLQQFDEATP